MKTIARRLMILGAVGSLMLAPRASAQVTTGTVSGTIKDSQGGVIPGATVVLTSEARGTQIAAVVSNETGDFVIPNVTADTYTVEVTMASFKTLLRKGVPVSGGDRVALGTLVLEVGGAQETVNVTGEAPLLQAQSGERSYVIASEQVENLPLSNRNFASLASLAPGVSGTNRIGGGGQTNYVMDGVSVVDTGNNSQMLQLNVEAIAEVKVLTANYQAEYGRSSGLQITAVTKSGSNRFHGSLYDVKRNSDWNENSMGQRPERRPQGGDEAGRLGLQHRWARRKAGRLEQSVLFLQPGIPSPDRRRDGQPLPASDRPRAAGRLLAEPGQYRQSLPVHPRRELGSSLLGDQHHRLLPGRRRRRPHPAEPPVCAGDGHPEQSLASAKRHAAGRARITTTRSPHRSSKR